VLELRDIRAGYGKIEVLHGLDLTVAAGEIITVIGANGAGKSTLLRAISGIVRLSGGTITLDGQRLDTLGVEQIVGRRVIQVPEGRQLFGPLTVAENLALGSYSRRRQGTPIAERLKKVFALFPRLEERQGQQAGTLSGGEQQMLAIGRALTGKPNLLLLDEPSMGLAPLAVERIFEALAKLNEQGLTMLMVEQNAEMALSLAHLAVVLQTGNVTLSGTATALRQDDRVRASYLGGEG
jgi:branched-chain amino acid transport system ATP-binding protein